ncbi:MAG: hypothetical protein QXI58_02210, partial [Candidatus Micrarchaeia archaeon]
LIKILSKGEYDISKAISKYLEKIPGKVKNFAQVVIYIAVGYLVIETVHVMLSSGAFSVIILGGVARALTVIIVFGISREMANFLGSDITFDTLIKLL